MKKAIYILFILANLFSCSNENYEGSHSIELNKGKKWAANPATIQGIDSMQDIMATFMKGGNFKIDDYDILSIKLKKEFQLIFKNCTMTGPAHQQLHNYLQPILKLTRQLKSKDITECENAAQKMKEHLSLFENYFE